MYFHQGVQHEDSDQFVGAIMKDVKGLVDNQSWKLVKVEDVPKDAEIKPTVWTMRRKRNLSQMK